MKRWLLGTALALLPACVQESPLAQEEKTAEQQLKDGIPQFCASTCWRVLDCKLDFADDCTNDCREYMSVFVGHGDWCLTLGQTAESCINDLKTCDELQNNTSCEVPQSEWDRCKAAEGPPKPGDLVTCDVSSSAGGTVPGVEPAQSQCDIFADNCGDGSSYRVSCLTVDGVLVCNCFKDGVVNGTAFTPADGICPLAEEVSAECGWNLSI